MVKLMIIIRFCGILLKHVKIKDESGFQNLSRSATCGVRIICLTPKKYLGNTSQQGWSWAVSGLFASRMGGGFKSSHVRTLYRQNGSSIWSDSITRSCVS